MRNNSEVARAITERGRWTVLGMELLQFVGVMAAFAVAVVLWIFVVFIPGRTMESWEDQRSARRDESREDPVGSGPSTLPPP